MVDGTHAAQVTEIETMTADYLRENVPEVAQAIDSGGCFYSVAKEPWLSRVWRKLGFRRPHVEGPGVPREGFAEGCIIVESVTHFDWKDRLRILVSGKVSSEHAIKTDVVVLRSRVTTDVAVLPPWRK